MSSIRRALGRTARLLALWLSIAAPSAPAAMRFERIAEFAASEARQGVAVDERHVYAIDGRAIGKYTKQGEKVAAWAGPADGPIVHLDSGVVVGGRIYCAHSNYDALPMTSSIEVFDAETLEHVASHSLGIRLGSLTWVDERDGTWWGTFANYDRPGRLPDGARGTEPYGGKRNTMLVRFGAEWQIVESWIFPAVLLERFGEMSNSGGSWSPDGELYLTGHDLPEIYRIRFPRAGSRLELAEIVPASVRGQGIAWDRSRLGVLYGVVRATKEELAAGGGHRVVALESRPATAERR